MSGGGRSTSLQSAPLPALVLQAFATILAVFAAICWLWAGLSPLEVQLTGDSGQQLRWWTFLPAALGIAIAVLTGFAFVVRGLLGLLVNAVLLLGLTGGAVAFGTIVPRANPVHPIGSAVPYGFAGFVFAGTACLVTLVAMAVSGGWSTHFSERPIGVARRRSSVLAVVLATVLAGAVGLVAVDRSRDYLLRANEYRAGGDVDREPADPAASTLAGGDQWRLEVPGLTLSTPALTDYGMAMASGESVIMVDRATGAVRWRYTRSDVVGAPSVASTARGRQVLVWWGLEEVYVLDARTGRRVGHWPERVPVTRILDPLLPVVIVARSDTDRRIARLSPAGRDRWTYPLGVCEQARARLAEAVVVVELSSSCGTASSRIVGLDADTGLELWSSTSAGDVRGVGAGAVLLVTPLIGDGAGRMLTAVDVADGETRWSRELPTQGKQALPCVDVQVQAGPQIAVVVCTWDVTDYPLGPAEQYVSTARTYDAVTGSMLRTIPYPGTITSTAVSADGRVLLARADPHAGWVLDVLGVDPAIPRLSIGPEIAHLHSTVRTLTAVGDQVFVVEARDEQLRCLR
jgi:hypothetical protein